LSVVPLAVIGGGSIRDFAITIIFGIVVGTSSSIFIASPILLYLGEDKISGPSVRTAALATAKLD
jgi:preprotein translocase subunit SecF